MTITIPDYRAKSRNMTATQHWRNYQRHRNELIAFMTAYCTDKTPIYPAQVTIEAYYKGKRCIDTSNIDDKIVCDGLMHLGILEDDTPEHNPIVTKMAFSETGEDKLVITVSTLE